ncbi:MAG: signal peptidase I [Clostridiales bacterium]|nr:signal peptidase I [Clostridiales bacterium]
MTDLMPRVARKRMNKASKRFKRSLKLLENILFILFMAVMAVLIFSAAQSRITGKEPSLLGHRLYIVDSGSMSPTIDLDSMIVVKEMDAEDVDRGDVVTYYGNTESVRITHRIAEVLEDGSFITKGDANTALDPVPLDGGKVIGKVVLIVPLMGVALRFLGTLEGIVTVAVLGILWIVLPKLFARKGKRYKGYRRPVSEVGDAQKTD